MYKSLSLITMAALASAATTTLTYDSCLPASALEAASPAFVAGTNSTFMSLGLCSEQCAKSAYLALYETICYCGPSTPSTLSSTATKADCSTPCPGYPIDTCGGGVGVDHFVSLYSNSNPDVQSAATSNTTSTSTSTTATTSSLLSAATQNAGNSNSSASSTGSGSGPSSTPSVLPISSSAGPFEVGSFGVLAAVAGLFALL